MRTLADTVAVEEPLEISLGYWIKDSHQIQRLALTMRTPGNDRELVAGFLLAEGVVERASDMQEFRFLGALPSNELLVELAPGVDVEMWRMQRATFMNSSCGICGKANFSSPSKRMPETEALPLSIDAQLLGKLPALLESHQRGFAQTGGLHAAALVTAAGIVEQSFEDIGRHNALDKLVGWAVLNEMLPLKDHLLFLSSRSSFELVQKAAAGGAPILATVGSPSSLAIETARQCGLTLIGFVRENRFNVYSGEWRVH